MSSNPISGFSPHAPPSMPAAAFRGGTLAPPGAAASPAAVPPAAAHAAEPPKAPRPDPAESLRQLQEVVEKMNEEMRRSGRNLAFSVDKSSNRVVVSVKAADTGEVIRQIPDEAVLRFAHTVDRIKGLLHNAQS